MKKIISSLLIVLLSNFTSFVSADVIAGAKIYGAQCANCHGPKALGDQAVSAPRLSGQQTVYLEEQLHNFQTGKRGSHPSDTNGSVMRNVASSLSSEQIANVSHYLGALPSNAQHIANNSERKEDQGKELYQSTCAACHGDDASGSENLFTPNLKVLNAWYLQNQFDAYLNGWRGDSNAGSTRSKVMRSILAQLDNKQQQIALIKYIPNL